MKKIKQNFKQVLWRLLFPVFFFLFTMPVIAQDSCSTYSFDFMHNELRVFADTTHWVNWTRSVSFDIDDFPEEGFFHIQTLAHYNSGNKQKNESFYVHVRNSQLRFPQDPNITTADAAYKIVVDDSTAAFDGLVNRDAGLFYFEKGCNTIIINHYKIIAEAHPDFVNYYDLSDTGSAGANSGNSIGGRSEPESVEIFFVRLLSPFCTNDLRLQCNPQFTMDCAIQRGQLDVVFDVDEADMQLFDLSEIDSLVLKMVEPPGMTIKNTSAEWQSSRLDSLLSFRWIPGAQGLTDLLNFQQNLALEITFDQLDSITTVELICQIFTNSDTQLDSQFVRQSILVDPRCSAPVYDLAIEKSGVWRFPAAAGILDYRLVLRNLGPDEASAFTVRDTLDKFLYAFNFTTEPDSTDDSGFFWLVDRKISAGDSLIFSYQAQLLEGLVADQTLFLENKVSVAAPYDSNPANNRDSTLHVYQTTDLALDLQASADSVCLADSIRFRYTVRNPGPTASGSIILQAGLPATLLFNLPDYWQQIDSAQGFVLWQTSQDFLTAGDSAVFEIDAFVPAVFSGEMLARASLFAKNDSLAANNSAQVAVKIGDCTTPRSSDLRVTKQAQKDTVDYGQFINYQIEISNLGPDTVFSFYLLEKWPQGFTAEDITSSQPGLTVNSDTIRWPGFFLSPAAQLDLTIQGSATAAGANFISLQNFVEIVSPGDGNSGNNQDSALVILRPDRINLPADLSILKRAMQAGGKIGDEIEFELEITNNGPGSAQNFTLADSASIYLQLTDFSLRPDFSTTNSGRWYFDRILQPGEKIFLRYTATILSDIPQLPAELQNRATVEYPDDVKPGNNKAEHSLQVFCGLDCFLDKNVYAPAVDSDLEINFETCRTDRVSIKIYDLLGTYITTVKEGVYSAGVLHKTYWNGLVNSGKKMGSGAYILVVHTTDQHCKLKFLLVQ